MILAKVKNKILNISHDFQVTRWKNEKFSADADITHGLDTEEAHLLCVH